MINVKGLNDIDDPYYRYQMEEVKIINQGIKTVFTNIINICESLNREPTHLIKFMQKKFGTSFTYKNDVATTVKKDLTSDSLQEIIYLYIEEHVLCEKCKNPETVYCKEKKKIFKICNACSHKIQI
jgi:translation initiation factor 2 subunit 2